MRLDGPYEFDSSAMAIRSTGMVDRLRAGKPPQYFTQPGQLSLLPSAGREMSSGRRSVMLRGWGVKARWLIPYVDKRVGGRLKLCDPSLTRASLSA